MHDTELPPSCLQGDLLIGCIHSPVDRQVRRDGYLRSSTVRWSDVALHGQSVIGPYTKYMRVRFNTQ